jgi:hypothetical protein
VNKEALHYLITGIVPVIDIQIFGYMWITLVIFQTSLEAYIILNLKLRVQQ